MKAVNRGINKVDAVKWADSAELQRFVLQHDTEIPYPNNIKLKDDGHDEAGTQDLKIIDVAEPPAIKVLIDVG